MNVRTILAALLAAAPITIDAAAPDETPADAPRQLPIEYAADRYYVTPTAKSGEKLRFFTDTGGGFIIHADTAERLGLATRTIGEGEEKGTFAPFPELAATGWIPPPTADTRPLPYRNLMYVAPRSPRSESFGDGMLGQEWFGGGVWTFDYPGRALSWQPSAAGLRFDPRHTAKLGFPAGADGVRSGNFPSIEAAIDGETLPFLFDTGATLELSDSALDALGDGGPKSRGTSFIVASVFDRWREKHPDWRVIERAEDNPGAAPIIEVPELLIAGHRVGPVWFTRRPDPNFHEFMSKFMDRRVEGALGGSAFRFFRITADYPGARALFEVTKAAP